MNADQVMSLARQILTFAGGFVVAKGWVDDATMATAVGAIVTLGSVAWSMIHHANKPAA